MQEMACINTSLLALTAVVAALQPPYYRRHIPYR